MALAEASRRAELARPTPFTSAGPARDRRQGARPPGAHAARRLPRLPPRVPPRPLGGGHVVPEPCRRGAHRRRACRTCSACGTASGTSGSPGTGYPVPLPVDADTGAVTYSAWAFYPLYPYLVKAVMVTGLPFTLAGRPAQRRARRCARPLLIWAVLRSGVHADRQPQRDRLALVAACLWCFYPTTAVMLKPYTEALAAVLVAGALLLLVRRRYLFVARSPCRSASPAAWHRRWVRRAIHLVVRWREDRAAGIRPLRAAGVTRSSCSAPCR